jgi:hypothetical protein
MANVNDFVYTREQARRKTTLGISAFDRALQRGDFPSLRIGGRVLIPRRQFEAILAGEQPIKAAPDGTRSRDGA